MQLVKASRDALLKPLQVVSGIVERRQTLPILANILVRKDGERVSFTATDLEIQIQTSADIGAGKDAAATTVAARKLVDILRALPEADVALSLSNRKLAIASGKSRFNLQTLAAEEYPDRRAGRVHRRLHVAGVDLQVPAVDGPLRDGAAGHPLLPERHAAGGRRHHGARRRHRRTPARAVRSRQGRRVEQDRGDHPAQDGAGTVAPAAGLRRSGARPDGRQPGQVQLRQHRAGLEAGRGQVPGLPAGAAGGEHQGVRDRPRGPASMRCSGPRS